jgi:peptide deformylase
MLKMIIHPDPILRQKSHNVTDPSDSKIKKLIPQMMATMKEENGVGLAAPQVGENIRMFVVNHKEKEMVFINPVIVKKSLIKEWGEEGCLSIPGKFGEVKRSKRVAVEYLNEGGVKQSLKAHGLLSRIIQHEIDHLDGILFIDKCKNLSDISY